MASLLQKLRTDYDFALYRTRNYESSCAEDPALPVRCVARYTKYGAVRGFETETGDDRQDLEVCDRLSGDYVEVFVVRIFVVENTTDALHIGAHHKSQGDRGNIAVLSCALAQQIGFAMNDVETIIEQWAKTGY